MLHTICRFSRQKLLFFKPSNKSATNLTQKHNVKLLEYAVRNSYQKVLITNPPKDLYMLAEAFLFGEMTYGREARQA